MKLIQLIKIKTVTVSKVQLSLKLFIPVPDMEHFESLHFRTNSPEFIPTEYSLFYFYKCQLFIIFYKISAAVFNDFLAHFGQTHQHLGKSVKKDPCLEDSGPKNPPILAAHTCTHKMLCTPSVLHNFGLYCIYQ